MITSLSKYLRSGLARVTIGRLTLPRSTCLRRAPSGADSYQPQGVDVWNWFLSASCCLSFVSLPLFFLKLHPEIFTSWHSSQEATKRLQTKGYEAVPQSSVSVMQVFNISMVTMNRMCLIEWRKWGSWFGWGPPSSSFQWRSPALVECCPPQTVPQSAMSHTMVTRPPLQCARWLFGKSPRPRLLFVFVCWFPFRPNSSSLLSLSVQFHFLAAEQRIPRDLIASAQPLLLLSLQQQLPRPLLLLLQLSGQHQTFKHLGHCDCHHDDGLPQVISSTLEAYPSLPPMEPSASSHYRCASKNVKFSGKKCTHIF